MKNSISGKPFYFPQIVSETLISLLLIRKKGQKTENGVENLAKKTCLFDHKSIILKITRNIEMGGVQQL